MSWVEAIPNKRRRNKRQRNVSRRSRLHVLGPLSHSAPSYLKKTEDPTLAIEKPNYSFTDMYDL